MIQMTSALASYAQSSATTASPFEIVRMAYERVLTACDRAELAERAHGPSWIQQFHDETVRAQAILVELSAGLALHHHDVHVVDLARQLDGLYTYAMGQLVQANVSKSSGPLHAVRMVIGGLRDAWVLGAQ